MNEVELAHRYIRKAGYAKDKGHEFSLTFAQYKRLITTKRCRYTGIELTTETNNKGLKDPNFCTLDRVDNSLGYITGNVVACCYAYNQFKGVIENPSNVIDFKTLCKAVNVQKVLQKKTDKIKAKVIDDQNESARTSYNFSKVKSK